MMTTTYKQDLVRISLTPSHWRTLHDLAIENRLTVGEMISEWLDTTIQKIIDEAEFIDTLQETPST